MQTMQFTLDNFNPDGMTVDQLHEWINFIGPGLRPQVAKQWFPGMKGQFQHARNVRNYCWNKITAMQLRKDGYVVQALRYEQICDKIYRELPEIARW